MKENTESRIICKRIQRKNKDIITGYGTHIQYSSSPKAQGSLQKSGWKGNKNRRMNKKKQCFLRTNRQMHT